MFQFDQSIGQEASSPLGVALRSGSTRQDYKMRFRLPINFALVLAVARSAIDCIFQAFFKVFFSDPFDRRARYVQGLANVFVQPVFICFEQNGTRANLRVFSVPDEIIFMR